MDFFLAPTLIAPIKPEHWKVKFPTGITPREMISTSLRVISFEFADSELDSPAGANKILGRLGGLKNPYPWTRPWDGNTDNDKWNAYYYCAVEALKGLLFGERHDSEGMLTTSPCMQTAAYRYMEALQY